MSTDTERDNLEEQEDFPTPKISGSNSLNRLSQDMQESGKNQTNKPHGGTASDLSEEQRNRSAQSPVLSPRPLARHAVKFKNKTNAEDGRGNGRENNRPSIRTLILRIQTCTVAQDLRDALNTLAECTDLPYEMEVHELTQFMELLSIHRDDPEVIETVLQVLVSLVDISTYPDTVEEMDGILLSTNVRRRPVLSKEKFAIRARFGRAMFDGMPLFLDLLNDQKVKALSMASPTSPQMATFFSRLCVVKIFRHLQDIDLTLLQRLFLDSHEIGLVVDLLKSKQHDGTLRSEVLELLSALTATDADLQTIVAFNNAFDLLFLVIQEEGGIDGGAIVSDCLTVFHNMLRGNGKTQKLFREMGCAKHLRDLFSTVPKKCARLLSVAAEGVARGKTEPTAVEPLSSTQATIVMMVVSILSCVLKEADPKGELQITRESLRECGVLDPLVDLALCGCFIDDGIRIASLRVLASFLMDFPPAIVDFMNLKDVTTLVRAQLPSKKVSWPALRAVLEYLFTSNDATLLSACVQVTQALLSAPSCQEAVTHALLDKFAPPNKVDSFRVEGHYQLRSCGQALAYALLCPTPHTVGKYYAGLLLSQILPLLNVADRLLELPWGVEPESPASKARSPHKTQTKEIEFQNVNPNSLSTPSSSLPSISRVPLSKHVPATFFMAFFSYFLFCVQGGHISEQMDTAALGAYTQAVLTWFRHAKSTNAVVYLLSDPQWYPMLLQQAGRDTGQVNIRFWCAAIAADVCCMASCVHELHESAVSQVSSSGNPQQRQQQRQPPPKPLLDQGRLLELFTARLGGVVFLDNLLFDVQASTVQWSNPVMSAWTSPSPALYDMEFVKVLQKIIERFKSVYRASPFAVKACSSEALGTSYSPSTSEISQTLDPIKMHANKVKSFKPSTLAAAHESDVLSTGLNNAMGDSTDRSDPNLEAVSLALPNPAPPEATAGGALDVDREELRCLRVQMTTCQGEIERLKLENEMLRGELGKLQTELEIQHLKQTDHAAVEAQPDLKENEVAASSARQCEEQKTLFQQQINMLQERYQNEIKELQDNIKLLEDALAFKEEEREQLVNSLNMLGSQLDQMTVEVERNRALEAAFTNQRDGPLVESPFMGSPTVDVSADSVDVNRNGVDNGTSTRQIQREKEHELQKQLEEVVAERDDLLVLLAEITGGHVPEKSAHLGEPLLDHPPQTLNTDATINTADTHHPKVISEGQMHHYDSIAPNPSHSALEHDQQLTVTATWLEDNNLDERSAEQVRPYGVMHAASQVQPQEHNSPPFPLQHPDLMPNDDYQFPLPPSNYFFPRFTYPGGEAANPFGAAAQRVNDSPSADPFLQHSRLDGLPEQRVASHAGAAAAAPYRIPLDAVPEGWQSGGRGGGGGEEGQHPINGGADGLNVAEGALVDATPLDSFLERGNGGASWHGVEGEVALGLGNLGGSFPSLDVRGPAAEPSLHTEELFANATAQSRAENPFKSIGASGGGSADPMEFFLGGEKS